MDILMAVAMVALGATAVACARRLSEAGRVWNPLGLSERFIRTSTMIGVVCVGLVWVVAGASELVRLLGAPPADEWSPALEMPARILWTACIACGVAAVLANRSVAELLRRWWPNRRPGRGCVTAYRISFALGGVFFVVLGLYQLTRSG